MNRYSHTATRKKTPGARILFLLIGNFVFFVAIVTLALRWGDGRILWQLVTHIQLKWLALAVFFQFGTYLCVTLIWKVVLQSCGTSIPAAKLFALSLAKLFSDQTVPSFGISGSIVAVRGFVRRKSSGSAAAAAVIMNTTSRYLPYFLLFSIAIGVVFKNHLLNQGLRYLAVTFTLVLLVLSFAILTLIWIFLNDKVPSFLRRIRGVKWFLKAIQSIPRKIFKNVPLWLLAFTANTAIFLLDACTFWMILFSLGTPAQPLHVFASFMITSVVTDLAIVPGRFGVFEGSSIALLHLFKIPLEQAIAATALFRGLTYWLPMIPGFLVTQREFRK